jgi:hypothetical protein
MALILPMICVIRQHSMLRRIGTTGKSGVDSHSVIHRNPLKNRGQTQKNAKNP